jgi:hypothetical protein
MTSCIGCGCDDHHACHDGMRAGCHWLCLDVTTGTGICSACHELRPRWNGGAHHVLPEFTELRVIELLEDLYEPGDAVTWFRSPQKLLDGQQPMGLVAMGEIRRVRQVIDQLREGAFL